MAGEVQVWEQSNTGISEAGLLYETTRKALAANPTAAAWREVLGSAEETARDYAIREDLGSILALDDVAWQSQRNQAGSEARTLRELYNSISELEDSDTVGEGWATLALRSLQRLYLIIAAWDEGRDHMIRALGQIVPDIVRQGIEYVQQGASWWEANRWWVIPSAGALALAYVVRTVRR